MGIDIYARWKGQTQEEEAAQVTGFSVVHGHVGYLREAYHGEPYATRYLVREAFESEDAAAQIPAQTLKEQLPETIRLAKEREEKIYGVAHHAEIQPMVESFVEFVALCERKEQETGEPVTILASY